MIHSIQKDPKVLARTNPGTIEQKGEMGPVPDPNFPLMGEPVKIDASFLKTGTLAPRKEDSALSVDYYLCEVNHPKRGTPYIAECEDIIYALGMNFEEGEAFKAVWRRATLKKYGIGKTGDSPKRNAQKVHYYGGRMLAHDEAEELS
jgi:hypothetical protein